MLIAPNLKKESCSPALRRVSEYIGPRWSKSLVSDAESHAMQDRQCQPECSIIAGRRSGASRPLAVPGPRPPDTYAGTNFVARRGADHGQCAAEGPVAPPSADRAPTYLGHPCSTHRPRGQSNPSPMPDADYSSSAPARPPHAHACISTQRGIRRSSPGLD
jgi:hypothetical protein